MVFFSSRNFAIRWNGVCKLPPNYEPVIVYFLVSYHSSYSDTNPDGDHTLCYTTRTENKNEHGFHQEK